MELPIIGSWWPFAFLLLGWLFYLYLTSNHDYWKKRGIPYVKPLPIFGNLKDALLCRKNLGQVYDELYRKLDGYKFGGFFKLGQVAILIRDPELVKTVLVKDFNSFHDNDLEVNSEVDIVFGRNPFVLRGEKWKIIRSLLTPAFTTGKIKPCFPLIAEVCKELKECIEKAGNPEFEAKEICTRYTTDVVATCAYGIRGNALQNPKCEFREMGRLILEPGFWNNVKFLMFMFFPRLCSFLKIGFGSAKVNDFFLRIIKEVVTYRDQNNVTRADFLQHLIDIKNKGDEDDNDNISNGYDTKSVSPGKYKFTEYDVAAQASTFFVDGYETSSGVLAFALYALTINPKVQDKLREEVDSVIKKNGGELTFDGIQEMAYLEMVLSEVLRVYPPGAVLSKVCTKPFKLDTPSGNVHEVQPGTPVIIPLSAIQHDSKYFPDPERFDPERFNAENKRNIQKYTYFPFGDGPRVCLGYRFAVTQVKAGIASIVHNFELRPNKRTSIPFVPDPNYLLLAAKGGLWLDIVKRTDK